MRLRASVARVPGPLLLLLLVVLCFTTAWSVFNPAFQVPDEPQHFGYAESLLERGQRPDPVDTAGAGFADDMSSFARRFTDASGTYGNAFDLQARPPWSDRVERRYNADADKGSRTDGGGHTGAAQYPPLFYVAEAIPFELGSAGSAMDQIYLMRWFAGLWALLTAVGAWLLAGEVFGRNRLAQLLTAATVGLWPMVSFMSAAINPDGMLFALSALALWLMVRIARRGFAWRPALALAGLLIAGALTKSSAVALFPAALLACVAAVPAVRSRVGDRLGRLLGLAVVLFVIPAGLLIALAAAGLAPGQLGVLGSLPDPNRFASYLWQFYLPKLDSMTPQRFSVPVISDLPVYNSFFGMSWGVYSWIDVWFSDWVYKLFFGISLAVLAGGVWTFVRSALRRRRAPDRRVALVTLVLGVATLGILAGVHLQDYTNGISGGLPFAQGRYLFPVAAVGAMAVAGTVQALPARVRPVVGAGWLGFLVVFQIASLALIASRFYV